MAYIFVFLSQLCLTNEQGHAPCRWVFWSGTFMKCCCYILFSPIHHNSSLMPGSIFLGHISRIEQNRGGKTFGWNETCFRICFQIKCEEWLFTLFSWKFCPIIFRHFVPKQRICIRFSDFPFMSFTIAAFTVQLFAVLCYIRWMYGCTDDNMLSQQMLDVSNVLIWLLQIVVSTLPNK